MCPQPSLLKRLEAGELPDHEADALLPHVAECPSCGEALERYRRQNLDSRVLRTALRTTGSTEVQVPASGARGTPGGSVPAAPSASTDGWAALGATSPGDAWGIPDYERVRLCGEGAFGTVWAVRDRVGVHRALKIIDLARLVPQQAKCRESTALETYCRLVGRHPNLIEVFHVGVHAQRLYYTMELADSERTRTPIRGELPPDYRPMTLKAVIERGPVPVDTAIEVVLRLLRGLSRLHALGLAHRDIKPSNVVFVGRRPKLADIGMITADTASPSTVGTPEYMPPDRRMDPTADVYAMGRMLYELMVGTLSQDFPRLPSNVRRSTERWDLERVQAVLETACAAEAEGRYPHATRMLEELEACRELPYDALLGDLAGVEKAPPRANDPYRPYILAGIHALPWVLGLVLAIVLAVKLL